MNLRASLSAKRIPGTLFRSSGGITDYGMATEKEATTTVVLGHEV
jgi:hypothetical protein